MSGSDVGTPSRPGRLDRRRDLAGWLVTPLATLVAAPVLVCVAAMVSTMMGNFDRPPRLCDTGLENRCEEITLGMLAGHVVAFAAGWLLLWAVPWWRGLRTVRIVLAVVACVVLAAAPMRMG
ncbi:hypothetical protein E1091_03140 [Micromonospora fluostatini]|uniref:DUF998 domain-containing protein n=1 Tax=Micromonospora fluostatini TaxID=1629071 RepID=A0ABY2DKK0_9ACTN|nr:hypothetical protein E1091_03140 [Micromonospora fluostatini]